ncbi:MAG: SHOCT domain-containing protein [Austwickia sp.]|nr:MAG: SHOCT domain-containing protein [Austwickia sp.]
MRPAPQAAMPAPALPPEPATGSRPATDKEVLLGVLADLHAQGVLTAEEFAAKVRQIVTQG